MKTRAKIIALVALLFTLAAFLFWSWKRDKAVTIAVETTAPATIQPILAVTKGPQPNPLQALMQTPIEFYGIVLDQHGKPVPAANVSASVLDNMIKGSPLSAITDASGKFTIKSQGICLHIQVEKSGYYYVDEGDSLRPSSQGFDFGLDNGRGIHRANASSPIIFHLRKAGNPVPLDRLSGQSKVPRDGSPITISLSKTSGITLQIGCTTNEDNQAAPNAPYDWRCVLATEGGGIQEAKDEYSFTAPDGGYAPSAVIDMPKTLDAKNWNSRASKIYWLRFSDNTFGQIRFMMVSGGDHFFVIQGFRNSSPNDRNLEPKLDDR